MTTHARMPGGNTTIRQDNGDTVVMLYRTDVVRFSQERVILDSGGYRTNTTKARMNKAAQMYGLGFSVFQRNWSWFVKFDDGRDDVRFSDGMEIARKENGS